MKKVIRLINSSYGSLNRNIYILFIATIINKIGDFVQFFFAIFLRSKLNYTDSQIANYIIIAGAVLSVSTAIGGFIGDRFNRKTTFVVNSLLGATTITICGLLTYNHIEYIPYFLILAAFFFSINSPIINAIVADNAKTDTERKKAYSLIYLGVNIGITIAPMIAGRLLTDYLDIFFYLDAITTVMSVILIYIFIGDSRPSAKEVKEAKNKEKAAKGNALAVLLKNKLLTAFILFILTDVVLFAQAGYGLPLKLTEIYGKKISPIIHGNLMAFNAVVVVFATIFLTQYMKNRSALSNVVMGMALTTIGFGMYGFFNDSIILYYISVFIWTIGEILVVTNSNVFIINNTPINFRARFSAIYNIIWGIAYVISPKLMSILLSNYNPKTSWIILASIGVSGTVAMLILLLKHRNNDKNYK